MKSDKLDKEYIHNQIDNINDNIVNNNIEKAKQIYNNVMNYLSYCDCNNKQVKSYKNNIKKIFEKYQS